MITLRCTRSVRQRLHLPDALPEPPAPSAALGDWYVHLVRFGHTELALATSERSLLTVLIPSRELRQRLVPNLQAAVRALLAGLGVVSERIDREIAAMMPVAFGRATNRRILGSMSDFAFQAGILLSDGFDLTTLALRLSETPMSAIGARPSDLGIPREVARELLAAASA